MSHGFFLKTAWSNVKKNYRFYVPHIVMEAGLLACLYVVFTLATDKKIKALKGGDYLAPFMVFGAIIILLLTVVLILYSNSFIMKQRKHEFGLYNILGMEKHHVGKILARETFICSLISIILGFALGIGFYKLSALLICKILHADVVLGNGFISLITMIIVGVFFIFMDILTVVINRINIGKMKPVELLQSKKTGEKEPKVKWVILLLGILNLGLGYSIALSVKSPIKAVLLFFVAVFFVCIGTYCLFTSGTIFVLKRLKKNKKYYYNKKHMSPVAGLLYRMKQNAVGLASIAILSTVVIIAVACTASLYSGMQDTLKVNYPLQYTVSAKYRDKDSWTSIPSDEVDRIVRAASKEFDLEIDHSEYQKYLEVAYLYEGNRFYTKPEYQGEWNYDDLSSCTYCTEEIYFALTGDVLNLKSGEIAVCRMSSEIGNLGTPLGGIIIHGKTYNSVKELTYFPIRDMKISVLATYGIVVPDEAALQEIYEDQLSLYGENGSAFSERTAFHYTDTEELKKVGADLEDKVVDGLRAYVENETGSEDFSFGYSAENVWDAEEEILGMYGAFLFLGIIIGLVCLCATVLIIYYKQISEGYEDRDRYQIMKKVGMTDKEIKRSIRSQSLLIFFLPLVTAGVHVCFAFVMLRLLLSLLMLSSTMLFLYWTLGVFAVFALTYILIYAKTAKTYYKIVH